MNTANVQTWSEKQVAIFTQFLTQLLTHLVVIARAGTGKTTTIVEAVNRLAVAFPKRQIVVCAFNKSIANELVKRITHPNVVVKTLHAIGLSIVVRFWEGLKVSFTTDRADDLAQQVCGGKAPDQIKRLVATLHTKGREITPHARKREDLMDLALTFECVPDETWSASGFDLNYVIDKALEAMELAATVKPVRTGIDGADMIFLPVRNGWMHKWADDVIVDEAQDMTFSQLELAQGICKDDGRMMLVGDNCQAIYAFRGADSESLSRLQAELKANQLPLNTTYRCSKAVVREAQRLVPDFEAGENNPEGSVTSIPMDKLMLEANHGDFILSRLNAPLVATAMTLLRNGKRARVAGRDIGKGLIVLVRKLAKGPASQSIPAFMTKLNVWQEREITRWTAADKPAKVDAVRDQAEMLIEMAATANSVKHLEERIEALFTDDGLGQAGVITCSSVHKAKGLEADKVFVLQNTLYRRGWTQEEQNIEYVAITRTKTHLVWVTEPRKL